MKPVAILPGATQAQGVHSTMLPGAGVSLHALAAGQGTPLLLLHGFPDDSQLWAPLLPTLAAQHQVLAPDLRGYGLSDKPTELDCYRIDALVADVLALIEHLGGRCALAGHDWGGMLAWVVAARHPQAVSRLAILNAPHPCRYAQQLVVDPAQRLASAYVQRLCAPDAAARLARDDFALLWSVITSSTAASLSEAERAHSLACWSRPGTLQAMLNWYRALDMPAALAEGGVRALPDLGHASGDIAVPTLMLWGERDGSFPAACLDGLARYVPQLSLRRFPEGGHWLLREQPEAVAAALLEFFADVS